MPIVVNSNASATSASFNLSRANDSLRKSLERLSSGKRINNAADDAGGLAVASKLNSKINRTTAILQNTQNGLSYLQVQDSGRKRQVRLWIVCLN
jgi:flagellin